MQDICQRRKVFEEICENGERVTPSFIVPPLSLPGNVAALHFSEFDHKMAVDASLPWDSEEFQLLFFVN